MKTVRTTPGYHRLALEGDVTLSGTPTVMANDAASAAEKVAAKHGITLVVEDAPQGAESGATITPDGSVISSSAAVPDLAAGTSFVTGRGEPVTSQDVDQDDDAGDDAGDDSDA